MRSSALRLAWLLTACAEGTAFDSTDMLPVQVLEDAGPVDAGPVDVYQPPDAAPPPPKPDASLADAAIADAAIADAAAPPGDLFSGLIGLVNILLGGGGGTANDAGADHCAMAACGSALDRQFGLSVLDCGFTDCVGGFCKK